MRWDEEKSDKGILGSSSILYCSWSEVRQVTESTAKRRRAIRSSTAFKIRK
jgi:hypothetical protein